MSIQVTTVFDLNILAISCYNEIAIMKNMAWVVFVTALL